MSMTRRVTPCQDTSSASIDGRARALIASCGITLALIAGAVLFMSTRALGDGEGWTEARELEKPQLEAEWVWKRKAKNFDHMWRVPR